MATTKMILIGEYEGTRYHGFQLQANASTIQGEMEEAISKLIGEKLRVMAASRTDAGVHARGQVIGFTTGSSLPLRSFISGLNHYLPRDIAVREAYRMEDSFDVRRDALSREYNYYILNSSIRSPFSNGFAYRVSGNLDIEAMNLASQALVGEHDFASFVGCIDEGIKSTRRNVYQAKIEQDGDLDIFSIVANSFLPHQVRNTMGTLIQVGLGKMSVDQFRGIMEARQPGLAVPTAPACGLFLMRVNYPSPFGEEIK